MAGESAYDLVSAYNALDNKLIPRYKYIQMQNDSDDYRYIFLNDIPVLDTRAPAEFAQGAFPTAVNIPLMTDTERARIGTCYKEKGQLAAIELGHDLVSGSIKAQRVKAWANFAEQHPQGYLYCFRGGLRSQISQQWLAEAGIDYPRISGGYKAMRRFLIDELQRSVETARLVLISGATGSGKTRLVKMIDRAIDLEGLARHRGSAFGHLLEEQPSQINFENSLSIAMLKNLDASPCGRIYLEDEGRLIGKLSLPDCLRKKMAVAPLLLVEESFEQRVDILVEDYIIDLGKRFERKYFNTGRKAHCAKLLDDLARIKKRLGSERYKTTAQLLREAFSVQEKTGSLALHRQWIGLLLGEYYDPMYRYQLGRREGEVLASGRRSEIIDRIRSF